MSPNCSAISAKFIAAEAELGRLWENWIVVNSSYSLTTMVGWSPCIMMTCLYFAFALWHRALSLDVGPRNDPRRPHQSRDAPGRKYLKKVKRNVRQEGYSGAWKQISILLSYSTVQPAHGSMDNVLIQIMVQIFASPILLWLFRKIAATEHSLFTCPRISDILFRSCGVWTSTGSIRYESAFS